MPTREYTWLASAAHEGQPRRCCNVEPDRPGWLEYCIDAAGIITAVSSRWDAFARANGSPELCADRVVGAKLWSFITDDTTILLYQELLNRSRKSQRAACFPFRCDSPTLRRELEMMIVPLADGATAFRTWATRIVPRAANALLDSGVPRSAKHVTMCGWCKRVRLPRGEWLELEEATIRLRLLGDAAPPQITHGICPRCADQFG